MKLSAKKPPSMLIKYKPPAILASRRGEGSVCCCGLWGSILAPGCAFMCFLSLARMIRCIRFLFDTNVCSEGAISMKGAAPEGAGRGEPLSLRVQDCSFDCRSV